MSQKSREAVRQGQRRAMVAEERLAARKFICAIALAAGAGSRCTETTTRTTLARTTWPTRSAGSPRTPRSAMPPTWSTWSAMPPTWFAGPRPARSARPVAGFRGRAAGAGCKHERDAQQGRNAEFVQVWQHEFPGQMTSTHIARTPGRGSIWGINKAATPWGAWRRSAPDITGGVSAKSQMLELPGCIWGAPWGCPASVSSCARCTLTSR